MIIDLQRFVASERPAWAELEGLLTKLEAEPNFRMTLERLQRFHLLYERTAADLAKIATFSSEPETRRYLENLVARAYGEIHETRERQRRISPLQWFFQTLPQTFRRHLRAFWLSLAITLVGCAFGGFAIALDPEGKPALMPFSQLLQDPAKRVAQEERATEDRLAGEKTSFSAFLMTHNTRVSIFTLALGMTWGVGTIIMLFYNGVMLGAVAVDYAAARRGGDSRHSHRRPGWPGAGARAHRLGPASPAESPVARSVTGPDDAHFWSRRAAGLGGVCRSFLVAISRADYSLLGQDCVWYSGIDSSVSLPGKIREQPEAGKSCATRERPGCQCRARRAASVRTSALQIRTPEGIVFSQLLAGPVTRFLGWVIDAACIAALMMLLGKVL